MIQWADLDWKIEKQAWLFAIATVDDLIEVRPGVLTMIGWAGLQSLKRCLMAAWLARFRAN